jgi:peptidoglycan hydrolase CwlO-like protein
MVADEPAVKVTLSDIYKKVESVDRNVADVNARVAEVDRKIDPVLIHVAELKTTVTDHETRIRLLERRVWQAAGACAVLGTGVGLGVSKALGGA